MNILMWHHFEQHEAGALDARLKAETRKKCFEQLSNVVDTVHENGLTSEDDRIWMRRRVAEISSSHPTILN
jgi:hypothetical protein